MQRFTERFRSMRRSQHNHRLVPSQSFLLFAIHIGQEIQKLGSKQLREKNRSKKFKDSELGWERATITCWMRGNSKGPNGQPLFCRWSNLCVVHSSAIKEGKHCLQTLSTKPGFSSETWNANNETHCTHPHTHFIPNRSCNLSCSSRCLF